jgi:superfamily II DNA or RNA helicase
MPFLTENEIRHRLGMEVLMRGKIYQQAGRVRDLSIIESKEGVYTIAAKVQGSKFAPYDVLIRLQELNNKLVILSSCSCTLTYDCKHVAATLLESLLYDTFHKVKPDPAGDTDFILKAMQAANQKEHAALEFNNWVNNLEVALTTETPTPRKPNDFVLVYLLHLHPYRHASWTLTLLIARRLKTGRFGSQYKAFSYHLDTHLRALLPVDHDILHQLEVAERVSNPHSRTLYQSQYELTYESSQTVVKEMIKTGRCYWNDHQDNTPLKLGLLKQGSLVWEIEEDGKQRLTCLADGKKIQLIPVNPFLYLELVTRTVGELELEMDPKLVLTLLSSPAVPPQHVAKMENVVKEKLSTVEKIPLPHQFKTTKLKAVKPKPKLHLFGTLADHPFFYKVYRHSCNLPLGRMSFMYEGIEVPVADPLTVNSVDKETRSLRVISRDLQGEGEYIKRFLEVGVEIFSKRYPGIQLEALKPFDFIVAPIEDKIAQENFLYKSLAALKAEGWIVIVEPSFPAKYIINVDDWYTEVHETNKIDWFSMEVGFLLNGQKINILPLLVQLIEKNPEQFSEKYFNEFPSENLVLTLPSQQTIAVPTDRIKGILATLTELYDTKSLDRAGLLPLPRLRTAQVLDMEKAMSAARMRWLGEDKLQALSAGLAEFTEVKSVAIPKEFKGHLRDYQKAGVDWLNFLREYNLGGVLSDDMGLGKTIQTLAHLLIEKESGRMDKPCLIVAPTSLMENWRAEAKQFTPSLRVLVLQGLARKELFEKINKADIILTTYPLVVRDKEVLLAEDFYMIILDEAQFIKNANTKAYLILQQIRAQHRLCLTGTPMENHLGELWSLFNFLSPGLLGEHKQFNHIFRTPIEKHGNAFRRQSLNQRVKPYLLRRTKEQVVLELPAKTEIIHNIVLEEAQLDLYESIRLAMESKVKTAIEAKGFASSQIIILDALLKLRQVCCDPRLLKLEHAKKVKESAKFTFLMEMLAELTAEGRKILLFSSFTTMLALIEEGLIKEEMSYVKLTGSTVDRQAPIQRFQNGEVSIFLISLKAGGTGLNLTAADTVIHYDPWWNPAVEAQATDRAHRMGQTKPVFVYKLVTTGTVEEKILKMQEKKRALLEGLFDEKQEANATKISPQDLKFLFQPITALEET